MRGGRSRRRRILYVLAILAASAALLYAGSAPLLTAAGKQLVHEDPVERVDALIVLAPGLDRVIEAAQLYRAGHTPLILLTREPAVKSIEFLRTAGVQVETGEDLRHRVLEELGVPASSIVVLEGIVTSTADEARALARWASARPIRSVMVVTSPSHTGRSRLTFRHILRDRPIKVLVRPSTIETFQPEQWWRTRSNLRDGILEWQKLVYYQLVELRLFNAP